MKIPPSQELLDTTQPETLFDDLLIGPNDAPIRSPSDWEVKRVDILRRYRLLLGEEPAEHPAVTVRVLSEEDVGAYWRRKVVFPVEVDEEAEAWLLVPKRLDGRAPAVVCLHGTTQNGKDQTVGLGGEPSKAYAHHLTLRGFITLAPDHFCAGARTPAEGPFETAAFYRQHPEWTAVGKAAWDAARAVDALCTLSEVDARRIGSIGHSLGGHGALFHAAYDERVAAAVANCGAQLWRVNSVRMNWARDKWYSYLGNKWREVFLRGELPPVDFHEITALIAPRPFLDISSLEDSNYAYITQVHLRDAFLRVSDVYAILGAAPNFAHLVHRAGHGMPFFARELAYAWLEQHLKPAAPQGKRGISTFAGHNDFSRIPDVPAFLIAQNERILLIAQIETAEGVRNREAVLSTPGLDVCFVGTGDLAMSLGFAGQPDHPEVIQAAEEVLSTAREHGLLMSLPIRTPDRVEHWVERGMNMLTLSTDGGLLSTGAGLFLSAVESVR